MMLVLLASQPRVALAHLNLLCMWLATIRPLTVVENNHLCYETLVVCQRCAGLIPRASAISLFLGTPFSKLQ